MIDKIAPTMHRSRLFGVTAPEQAAAIMLKGYELGLGLAASFECIQVVQGKPTLSPRGALALIHRSGELAGMKITESPDACTVWMKRKNGFEYELTFTMDDAKRTGQVKTGSAWETYPANMLRWRAVGFVADVVFPDIIGGMKRADEFGATVDASGNVMEGSWADVSSVSVAPPPTEPEPTPASVVSAISLDELVQQYGAEAVMVAADGRIPATVEEVQKVAEKLGNQANG
jgi:hypothetical protein